MALIGAEAAVASAVTFFAAAIAFAYLADSIGLRIVPAIVLVAAAAAAAAAFQQMRRGAGYAPFKLAFEHSPACALGTAPTTNMLPFGSRRRARGLRGHTALHRACERR